MESLLPETKTPVKEEPDGFAVFYKAYPRHEAVANARRAWARIKPDEDLRNKIMYALEQQKKYRKKWKEEGGKYIPLPASWLNAERWNDEIDIHPTILTKSKKIYNIVEDYLEKGWPKDVWCPIHNKPGAQPAMSGDLITGNRKPYWKCEDCIRGIPKPKFDECPELDEQLPF